MGLMETRDPGYRGNRCREREKPLNTDSARRVPAPRESFPLAPRPATLPNPP